MNTTIRQDSTGEALDQHIRRTVEQLRRWQFDTTDSGDGRSKFATGADDERLDVWHAATWGGCPA